MIFWSLLTQLLQIVQAELRGMPECKGKKASD